MILKSTPMHPKRNRVTIHASGIMLAPSDEGCELDFTGDEERLYFVSFDERDLPTLKKVVAALSKSKEKTK